MKLYVHDDDQVPKILQQATGGSIMNLLNSQNTLQTSLVIRLTFLFLLTTIIILAAAILCLPQLIYQWFRNGSI